ncbi:MAG: hypothetical protein ACAH95_02635 [Fimbriimonas sp.]
MFGNDGSVVVPVVIEVEKEGQRSEESLNLPLDTKLVQMMKEGFGSHACKALRGLEEALLKGLDQPNREVRQASADVLPLVQEAVPFRVAGDIPIPERVEQKVEKIAKKVFERSGKRVVVTSAARTPQRQADAMRIKLDLGESPRRLYANKRAAGEIENAYSWAKKSGLPVEQVTETMAMVIQRQMDSGIFISRHLKEGAVDFRSRDLSAREKRVVRIAAAEEGAKVALESTPPHFHIEVF